MAAAALRLRKFEPSFVDGHSVAPQEIVGGGLCKWSNYLVGNFISKRLAFPTVKKHLEKLWNLKEPLDITLEWSLSTLELKMRLSETES